MQNFRYVVFDSGGKRLSGEIVAESQEQAQEMLERRSAIVLSLQKSGTASASEGRSPKLKLLTSGSKPVKTLEAGVILRNLAVMTENGVTLVEALDAVIDAARTESTRARLERVRDDIIGGKSIYHAMRAEEGLFPSLVCDMVRVAEEGGQLPTALAGAATYLERSATLKRRVMNALLYPAIMAFIAFATVVVLVLLILPNFEGIFSQMSIDLPLSTKVLMGSGGFIKQHFLLSCILSGVAYGLVRMYAKTDKGRTVVAQLILRMPVVGNLVKKLSIARALQSISALLSSNVSMVAALDHGASVAGNAVVCEGFLKAKDSIEQGAALSDALSKSSIFPKVLTQMVVAGERTGKLASMLQPMATSMEEEADTQLRALTTIIEPVIVVVMGVIVGFVTLAIVIPIFNIADKI